MNSDVVPIGCASFSACSRYPSSSACICSSFSSNILATSVGMSASNGSGVVGVSDDCCVVATSLALSCRTHGCCSGGSRRGLCSCEAAVSPLSDLNLVRANRALWYVGLRKRGGRLRLCFLWMRRPIIESVDGRDDSVCCGGCANTSATSSANSESKGFIGCASSHVTSCGVGGKSNLCNVVRNQSISTAGVFPKRVVYSCGCSMSGGGTSLSPNNVLW